MKCACYRRSERKYACEKSGLLEPIAIGTRMTICPPISARSEPPITRHCTSRLRQKPLLNGLKKICGRDCAPWTLPCPALAIKCDCCPTERSRLASPQDRKSVV